MKRGKRNEEKGKRAIRKRKIGLWKRKVHRDGEVKEVGRKRR